MGGADLNKKGEKLSKKERRKTKTKMPMQPMMTKLSKFDFGTKENISILHICCTNKFWTTSFVALNE